MDKIERFEIDLTKKHKGSLSKQRLLVIVNYEVYSMKVIFGEISDIFYHHKIGFRRGKKIIIYPLCSLLDFLSMALSNPN